MQSAPTSSQAYIRASTPADASHIVRLHLALLPHGFFARLGSGYLRVYHRSFMASPHAVSLVACRDERIVGFVAGADNAHLHQRWTLRHRGPQLILAGVLALAFRPGLAWEFLTTRTGRYLRSFARAARPGAASVAAPTAGGATGSGPVAVLTHVAVHPTEQGSGSGSMLVESFLQQVRSAGANRAELVTLCGEGASPFYERLGWSAIGEHEREGARYRRFTLGLA